MVSHDQNFKNLILDYPRDALRFFVPEEAPGPEEPVRIIPARQEQLQRRLGMHYRELDVPLLVEWVDGRREAILFALEEETDARRFSLHRLAHYCLDLGELFATDRVVPVAIFLRRAEAVPASLTLGSERHRYLTFDYAVCKLEAMAAEQWLDSDNVVARVNLPNMRAPGFRRVEVYAHAVRGLFTLESDVGKRAKYLDFIDIYSALTDNELRQYRREYPEEGAAMRGFYETACDKAMQQGMQRGMQRGVQQGLQRGRVEGERAVLERLLRRRFGVLPADVVERMGHASVADLEAWTDNVLVAGTLDDVFGRGR